MHRYLYRHRRTKRGISTVLGILLMVGILFTSVIPLFLYVNEVNNYYDRTVVDLKIADQERSMEDLVVFAYGLDGSEKIDVSLINRGPVSVNVTRIWVVRRDLQDMLIFNSTNLGEYLPLHLSPSAQSTIQNVTLASIITNNINLDYFNIEVATERGNKFSSQTNWLHFIWTTLTWETGTMEFQIHVIVLSTQGNDRYKIEIEGIYNTTHYDFIDSSIVQGQFFTVFTLPMTGTYNLTVTNIKATDYHVGNSTIVLTWIHPTAVRQFDDRHSP